MTPGASSAAATSGEAPTVVAPAASSPQPPTTPPIPTQPIPAPPPPVPATIPPPPPLPAYDPVTGQPYSDKTKLAAGLLQLLPGGLAVIGGIGRLYIGHTTIGVIQIVLSVVAWVSACCAAVGSFLFLPLVLLVVPFGAWLWFVIDGILLLTGRVTDNQGRLLR